MNRVTMSGGDGFWARVRAAFGRSEDAPVPAYGRAEIASANKKSRPAQRIDDDLRRSWSEAAQRHVSLCVLALEMDGYPEFLAAYGREAADVTLDALEQAITGTLSEGETACLRSGRAGFVLVLPDMPVLMARELASRIAVAVRKAGLPHRESHAGQVSLSIGLAVVNPQGALDRAVLQAAGHAVKKAQRRGLARLEVADLRSSNDRRSRAA